MDPVFIVGVPRSGTTLVASIVAGLPGHVVCAETHFLDRWLPTVPLGRRGAGELSDLATRMTGDPYFAQLGIEPAPFLERVGRERPGTPEALFALLLDQARLGRSGDRVVEKTPEHDEHVEALRAWYPACRLIWVVRDPRAIHASLRTVPWPYVKNPRGLGARWRRSVERLEARRDDARVLAVRYESLVADPEPEVRRLCDFLDRPFRAELIAPGRPAPARAFVDDWGLRHARRATGPIDGGSVERWRRELDDATATLVELGAGRATLRRWGYAPHGLLALVRLFAQAAGRRLVAGRA